MTIGDRIREVRTKRGLSQAEFARQVGVSRGVAHGWESGRNRPEQASMLKIARLLGTSISYLYGETHDPRPAPDWHGQGPSSEAEARLLEAAQALRQVAGSLESICGGKVANNANEAPPSSTLGKSDSNEESAQ